MRSDERGASDADAGPLTPSVSELRSSLGRIDDLGRRVTAEADVTAVLNAVVRAARELTGARYGALARFDAEGQIRELITHGVESAEPAALARLPEGLGVLGLLQDLREPLRLADLRAHPRRVGFSPGHPPTDTFLGVPIRHGDESFGNLYLADKSGGRPFTEADEAVSLLLVSRAAIAIHNGWTQAATRRRLASTEADRREVELLHAVTQIAVSSSDLSDVLARSLHAIVDGTGAHAAEVWLVERPTGSLVLGATLGEGAGHDEPGRTVSDAGLRGIALQRGVPVLSTNLAGDARLRRRGLIDAGFRACYALPMMRDGRPVGVLCLLARDEASLDPQHEAGFMRVAGELAMAVENVQLAAERERLLERIESERLRLLTLVDHAPVGVVMVDTQRNVTLQNREGRRILHMSDAAHDLDLFEQVLGYARRDGTPYTPDELPLQRALREGATTVSEEIVIQLQDGDEVPALIDAAPILLPSGERLGAVAILQDISGLVAEREARSALERYAVRDQVARDLHDDIIQSVYATGLALRSAKTRDSVSKDEALDRAIRDLDEVIADLRTYIQELSRGPAALAAGLFLRTRIDGFLAQHAGLPEWKCEIDLGDVALPVRVERQVYLVIHELISNVHRHAQATRARLTLRRDGPYLRFEVCDNGRGFERAASRAGAVGVRSVEQRIADLGGSLLIESVPGDGTRIAGEVTIADEA